MVASAIAAVLVAGYLATVKLDGGSPTCGIVHGCETVSGSPYSLLFGVPVAIIGLIASSVSLAGSLGWWWRGDRRALAAAYLIGLASLPVLAWLTYLELVVIEAVCVWCVAYAMHVVVGWIAAAVALWRRAPTASP